MIEFNNRKRSLFHKHQSGSNPYRIVILLALLIAGLYLLRGYESGRVDALFLPTSTPTRIPRSFAMEGEAQFKAGNLQAAIAAYQNAIQLDPNDARTMAELARIQTYYSGMATNDIERRSRLLAAMETIDQAIEVNSEESFIHAIRAFVYNWNSDADMAGEKAQTYLTQAEQSAIRAIQLDPNNALALAYYAEILVVQQKWLQGEENIRLALERDTSLMDVFRVSGFVQESMANYEGAIEEYLKAARITPNFTPLYLRIGANYRTLGMRSTNTLRANAMYEQALSYFAKAVAVNKQLGIEDPIPYLSIGRTYSLMGEFFAASLNVRTALGMLPESAEIYGQLGLVYFRARNYESAIPALQCAVRGCAPEISCDVRGCNIDTDPPITIQGTGLSSTTAVFYYTYGSVLAGMHRPGLDYCPQAVGVLAEVRQAFAEDPTILAIIQPSEWICESFGYTALQP